jgi:hypothetical protein
VWRAFGKAALATVAWTHPVEFVRIVANLMPREMEATATNVRLDRMSDRQLNALIANLLADGDPASEEQDAPIIVDRRASRRTYMTYGANVL